MTQVSIAERESLIRQAKRLWHDDWTIPEIGRALDRNDRTIRRWIFEVPEITYYPEPTESVNGFRWRCWECGQVQTVAPCAICGTMPKWAEKTTL